MNIPIHSIWHIRRSADVDTAILTNLLESKKHEARAQTLRACFTTPLPLLVREAVRNSNQNLEIGHQELKLSLGRSQEAVVQAEANRKSSFPMSSCDITFGSKSEKASRMIPLYPLFVLLYPVSAWVGFYPRPVNNPQISIRNKQPVNDFAILISGPDNSSPSIDRQIQCDGLPPDLNIAPFLTGQGWKHIPATIAWGSWSHPVSALALGNLREVCTKTAYGGSKAFNMGLWCDSESGGVRSQEFVPLRGSNAALGVLLMTCHMRCKCVPAELRDRLPASKVLESEGIGDREAVLGPLEGTERWWTRDGKRLFEVDYATEADGPVRYLLMTANPKHSNPRCEGRLPTWPLPESLRSRGVTYRSLQELCAATWFGGNVLGNTGAVCETEADQTHLRFLDYMAHPLLENRNFPAVTVQMQFNRGHTQTVARGVIDPRRFLVHGKVPTGQHCTHREWTTRNTKYYSRNDRRNNESQYLGLQLPGTWKLKLRLKVARILFLATGFKFS
ncbi:MAG: hypothetical protein M1814_001102 [Vezdaea aestivalis]|nr:MAG: hypothetical protein M1814_001102 [Vezdaea aestivalis]